MIVVLLLFFFFSGVHTHFRNVNINKMLKGFHLHKIIDIINIHIFYFLLYSIFNYWTEYLIFIGGVMYCRRRAETLTPLSLAR